MQESVAEKCNIRLLLYKFDNNLHQAFDFQKAHRDPGANCSLGIIGEDCASEVTSSNSERGVRVPGALDEGVRL